MSLKILVTLALFTTCFGIASAQIKTVADFEAQGLVAQRNGNCDEAIKYYAEAIKLDPKSFVAQANAGNCYLKLGKPEMALGFLKAAVNLRASDPLVHYVLGIAYIAN
jgi:tetratricopeptide (TPR) repeat protein